MAGFAVCEKTNRNVKATGRERERERRMKRKTRESVHERLSWMSRTQMKGRKNCEVSVHKTKVAVTPQQPVWPPCRCCCIFFFFFTLLRLSAKIHTTEQQQFCPFPPPPTTSPPFFFFTALLFRQCLRCIDSSHAGSQGSNRVRRPTSPISGGR